MKEQKIDLLIAAVIGGREKYEEVFAAANKEAEKKEQEAKRSYIGSRLDAEITAIRQEKEKTISDARAEILEGVAARAEALRKEELNGVAVGSHEIVALSELEKLSNMPITAAEFGALNDRFINSGYWARKQLGILAAQNGLPFVGNVGLDEKLGIIRDIVGGFTDYLRYYNGHGSTDMTDDKVARAFATVQNDTLVRAAARYSAGDRLDTQTDTRAAAQCYESIKYSDFYNAGMKLRNIIKNGNENLTNGLLLKMIADGNIPREVYELAGVDFEELHNSYEARVTDYQKQGHILENLKRDPEGMEEALGNDNNGYLRGLIISEARSDAAIHDKAVEVGLIEGD